MLPGNLVYLSWLILWLLKPLFDRIILHIISIRFFESGADLKRLFHDMGKSLRRGLPGDLLWRRFSPLRSAMMPVRVLEPQKKSGKETSKRKKLLKEGGIDYCFLLTLWGVALEIALLTGEVLFYIIIEDLFSIGLLYNFDVTYVHVEVLLFTAWCINYILVETIYVCMGFSLYINSRINVEGWDIEIMFRSFAEKIKNKRINGVLIIFFVFCMFLPNNISAADWEFEKADGDVPLEILKDIQNSPEFGGEEDSWGIRLKKPINLDYAPDFNVNPFLEKLRLIFANILRFILIVLITALAVILLFYVRRLVYERNMSGKGPSVKILHGIPAENPDELLQKAKACFEQNNLRMAWGYCTAAVIISWSAFRGLVFPPNATENDCADMVRQTGNSEEAKNFCKIINHWINIAYAGKNPPEGSFEEASAFCRSLGAAHG
jgi:hypothetical protein